MKGRTVTIRLEPPEEKYWRIYWTLTENLACSRKFSSLAEAGPVARAIMEEWNVEDPPPGEKESSSGKN